MAKNKDKSGKELSDNTGKDEKERKKKLDTFAYYLAWIAFVSAVGSAFVKLIKEWKYPQKDEYYK
jgi:hypothetical protein